MGCCYCSYGQDQKKDKTKYLSEADFEFEKRSLRREMAHIKTDDIAQNELIEELQKRVQELQNAVIKLLGWVDNRCGHCGYAPANGQGTPQIPTIIKRLTPFETYRAYLVGDYENDTENRGYQSDDDIDGRVSVKPPEMRSPVDYLPPNAGEDDRLEDRKKVKWMFMGIGSETGSSESEFSEYEDMLNDPQLKDLATEMLKKLYGQGVMDTDDESSDTEGEG